MAEYQDRDPIALKHHYIRHVSAMTSEGLHDKSAIAAELAYRDQRIAELEQKCVELTEKYGQCLHQRDQLEATVTTMKSAGKVMDRLVSLKEEKIAELEATNQAAHEKCENLDAENGELRDRVAALQAELAQIRESG